MMAELTNVEEIAAAQRLLDDLNGAACCLPCVSDNLADLERDAGRYQLVFDSEETNLLGADADSEGALCYTLVDEQIKLAQMGCGYLAKSVDDLWEWTNKCYSALRALPAPVADLLDSLTDRPWRAAVRRDVLDRLLVWPSGSLHPLAMVAVKVRNRPGELLRLAKERSPYAAWEGHVQKINRFRLDLMSLEGEVQDSSEDQKPKGTRKIKPKVNTIAVIREVQKTESNNDVLATLGIDVAVSIENIRAIRHRVKTNRYEL